MVFVLDRHNHEVIAHQFKCVLRKLKLLSNSLIRVPDLLTHLFIQAKFDLLSRKAGDKIFLRCKLSSESLYTDYVTLFKHAVVL